MTTHHVHPNRFANNIRLAMLSAVVLPILTADDATQYRGSGVTKSEYKKALETLAEWGHLDMVDGGYSQTEVGYRAAMREHAEASLEDDTDVLMAVYLTIGIAKKVANRSGTSIGDVLYG